MITTTALIVGAGQAGLAMSRALTARGVAHLVLERGTVANAWKTERWDSLTTLTPNWANGLPGAPYDGPEPDGYMRVPELVARFESYARSIDAPVQEQTEVVCLRHGPEGFRLETSRGPFAARAVILATGAYAKPRLPRLAPETPTRILQTTPAAYKRPAEIPEGGVLVVGASASGVQIARELAKAGRAVVLAVGSHLRLPRRYRGFDIEWWLETLGILAEGAAEIDDLERARRAPAPQLQGGPDPVDLNALQAEGVEVVGRLSEIRDGRALFSGGLAHAISASDLKMNRLLDQIDLWVRERGLEGDMPPAEQPAPTRVPAVPRPSLPLDRGSLRTVVWATGYRPGFDWVTLPVFNTRGRLMHEGGVASIPGFYALGLPVLRRRRSHQISGVGDDAAALAAHLRAFLDGRRVAAA